MLSRTLVITGVSAIMAFGQAGERVFIEGTPAVAAAERVGIVSNFAHSEFAMGGKAVKNAPYRAEAVSESVQVLADGNRIVRRGRAVVARDSEGRTRRDISLSGADAKVTVIHDPVANVTYTLQHDSKTARKMPGNGVMIQMESQGPAGKVERLAMPADVIQYKAAAEVSRELILEGGPKAFNIRIGGNTNAKSESLGKQNIEGIVAEGMRITNVIPAGEIGNERPIEIVFERWYSPELQLLVSSSHKDPMMGETTYKLTNLSRSEPLKSLFEVPPDYTVKEGEPGVPMFHRKIERE